MLFKATLSLLLSLGSALVAASPISSGVNATALIRACGSVPSKEFVDQAEAHFAQHKVETKSEVGIAVASIPVYCALDPASFLFVVVNLTSVRFAGHVIYKTTSLSGGYIPDSQISASISVLNADYASCGISFFLAGTDRTLNTNWFDKVGPGK